MLQKCSILQVAGVFFNEPTKDHYLIEISQKANLAHTAVKKHLLELKRLSIITEHHEQKGKRTFPIYKANINDKEYKKQKKISNLIQLQESKLIEFLKDNLMPKSIVLFGSFQKGEDIEDSDIDLFVECKKEEMNLNKFQKSLHRNIQLHFKDHFKKYPEDLKNNIINGLVLEGYLEGY
ncbi:nucleotidyltransferase domain-containing protein [Candidatus Woesearchaeota archaeon]|jgi:predicted nucleotidyltransferase|nr:nucleotidyltransferase domain-containing protein [Candidatus Woesearchaeota archaeon]MBT4111428.1 nucleotidyltransferase domain-containing protein [Candidatus Woesearchaeota archaeon]MBT4336357.1 nucleotidyltransferase domain-containing protein [Candidatus Woesearchaeota archaeon]MBT4469988.1 nucleotidyltransferase domain-containing protein [Candidatus Woesearchaeota archaeon]MBT6744288.1 nucleotidyltransferase domain-containing protein [Candidatus Woesearchaeota archaeon]